MAKTLDDLRKDYSLYYQGTFGDYYSETAQKEFDDIIADHDAEVRKDERVKALNLTEDERKAAVLAANDFVDDYADDAVASILAAIADIRKTKQ
jgi:hypothetical protein